MADDTNGRARVADRVSKRLLIATGLSFLVVLFAPLFFWLVEHGRSDDVHSIGDAYGWLARTLFENTSPYKLRTQFGFVSYWIVRVAGVSLVAFATATIASRFVATVIRQGAGMGTYKGSNHVLICGWSPKGPEIIRELRAREVEDVRDIVILADRETDPMDAHDVTFVRGSPSNGPDLARAGVDRVSTVIVLADSSNATDDPENLDARSLLTTLAVESMNPSAYTCVEVVKSENRQHFERTHADELVVSAELTGALLAASARSHGITDVVADLLTHPEGQELYRIPVPAELVGKSVRDAIEVLKDTYDSLFVGMFVDGHCQVNPPATATIAAGGELLVVRERPVVAAAMIPSTVAEHLQVLDDGLVPRVERGARVVVVGAGMAGLVAASELARAGHDPVIVEAQQRVGGRVLTLREPFAPGLWAEAGAMRIPRSHRLTMNLIERFGITALPFTMDNPDAYCYFGGRRVRHHELTGDPAALGFEITERERMPAAQLWGNELTPFRTRLADEHGGGWDGIALEYDQYAVREFLELREWSEGAIEMFGLLFNQEALMNSSFLELLREELGDYYTDLVYLDGGTDTLPRAFLPELAHRIRFGAKMVALEQSSHGVTVHCRNAGGRFAVEGDYAVLTTPFPVLRHVEVLQPFSRLKQRAIRQLHYDASAKVFLQFRRRFWEDDDGITGGGTVTDLAVRNVYYPDHGHATGRGVMLASYTWGEDAQRWGSLSPDDRVLQAIEDVTRIHPVAATDFEVGASKMWHDDEFAGGAFALFDPGQQTLLYEAICAPEGRVHFAGEHASLAHAWIQGAIESGVRAAAEIHDTVLASAR